MGEGLAQRGAIVVTRRARRGDGRRLTGRGAGRRGGGRVLPGLDRSEANEWVTVALSTGLGELRNGLVVRAADSVIAVGGSYGTLSEIALALQAGTPVFGLHTWSIEGVVAVDSPEEAILAAFEAATARRGQS